MSSQGIKKIVHRVWPFPISIATALLLTAVSLLVFEIAPPIIGNTASAAPDEQVVINELMYNPLSDNDNDEFLEVHNITASDLSLDGWCFTEGISLCFGPGDEVSAGGYIIVSPNAAQTLTTYGKAVLGEYTGKLSNGGEVITLKDSDGQVASTLTYDDSSPWPVSPDGSGPSLELADLDKSLNNGDNWSASLNNGGTPLGENSTVNISPPILSEISEVGNAQAMSPQSITVKASNVTTLNLVYKIMFEPDVTVAMLDDGTGSDQVSGDGVYSAMIPGQSAGSLVRYKVAASNLSAPASLPNADESINYYGYTVEDSTQEGGTTPKLQWFISDDDYAALIATPDGEEDYYPSVIAYDNKVFDNSEVRIKGHYSRSFSKKPFKVKLPKGYQLNMPGVLEYPLNEFHLNSDFADNRYITSLLSWHVFEQAGFPVPQIRKIQLQRNGSFEGAYTLAEKYKDEWVDRNPSYKDGEMYEDRWEIEYPDNIDSSRFDSLESSLGTLTGVEKHNYMLDNIDIQSAINYMAAQSVARSHDWTIQHNTFSYFSSGGRQRWSFLPWDLDLTMNFENDNQPVTAGYGRMINPYDSADYITDAERFVFTDIWDDPEFRAIYQRRIRTLVDEVYTSGQLGTWLDEELAIAKTAVDLDHLKTYDDEYTAKIQPTIDYIIGLGYDPEDPIVVNGYYDAMLGEVDAISKFPEQVAKIDVLTPANKLFVERRKIETQGQRYLTEYVSEGLIPEGQAEDAEVQIKTVENNPSSGDNYEYIELYNPNDYAVDISMWSIDGLNFSLPGGSVIPAKSSAYVVKNDVIFRNHYGGGKYVLAEYPDSLQNSDIALALLRKDYSVAGTFGAYLPVVNGSDSADNDSAIKNNLGKNSSDLAKTGQSTHIYILIGLSLIAFSLVFSRKSLVGQELAQKQTAKRVLK